MSSQVKLLPLTLQDRRKIRQKVIIFYIFGLLGFGLLVFAVFQLFTAFAVFFLILALVGAVLTAALVYAHIMVGKDLKNGQKNVFSGTVTDMKEVYTVSVSSGSRGNSGSTDFKSKFLVKLDDLWHDIPKRIFNDMAPGQEVTIEKTTQSEMFLNARVLTAAPKPTSKMPELESVEDELYEVISTRVEEKIDSNVRIKRYRPRYSDGYTDPHHYLVIKEQLYAVTDEQFDAIPVHSAVLMLKNEESGDIASVYARTATGQRIKLQ